MQLPDGIETWQVWLGLAIALGVLELFSLDLILLMLALGAVVGLVRPSVVKRLHQGPTLVLGHDALVGKTAVVVEEVSSQGGQVRINGELWTARPYDEDSVIAPGAKVDVFQIKGATALVHQVPELDP